MTSTAAQLLQAYYASLSGADKAWKQAFDAVFHDGLIIRLSDAFGGEELTKADYEERMTALRAVGVKATGFKVLGETEEPETVSYRYELHVEGQPDPFPSTDLATIEDGKVIRVDPGD